MLRFMRSCRTSRIRLRASTTRSIDFWISASIARSRRSQRSSWSSSLLSLLRTRFLTKFNQTRSQRSRTSSSSSSKCALSAERSICRILLTGERMNCYCCLSKMDGKFSSLYRKSLSFIYLLIFISWFIEIHLRIEIFVCHENFFFWFKHFRFSLSLRSDLIRIAYSSSNSLISRQSRKSVDLKEIISIEWL
jgi:hypothetical protein